MKKAAVFAVSLLMAGILTVSPLSVLASSWSFERERSCNNGIL